MLHISCLKKSSFSSPQISGWLFRPREQGVVLKGMDITVNSDWTRPSSSSMDCRKAFIHTCPYNWQRFRPDLCEHPVKYILLSGLHLSKDEAGEKKSILEREKKRFSFPASRFCFRQKEEAPKKNGNYVWVVAARPTWVSACVRACVCELRSEEIQ